MKDWIYKIYQVRRRYDISDKEEVALDIVAFETKQEVLNYVAEKYLEYFPNGKVTQRLIKGEDFVYTCRIYELNDYYRKVWYEVLPCASCHKDMTRLSIRQEKILIGEPVYQKPYFCSECQDKKVAYFETKELDHWNERCPNHYIYKITNKISNKIYIGYSSREVIFRWWEHLRHSSQALGTALQNEGIQNFTFEVLEQIPKTEKSREEMLEVETDYINKFDAIANGYNAVVSKRVDEL